MQALILLLASLLLLSCQSYNVIIEPYGEQKPLPAADLSIACDLTYAGKTAAQHKVLIFVDSRYFKLFHNWFIYYTNTCGNTTSLQNLELVCMDEDMQSKLSSLSLNCSDEYSSAVMRNKEDSSVIRKKEEDKRTSDLVWIKRLEIITQMLSKGIDLILSDTDAFWLRNPYPDLSKYAETSHIVASRGWFPFSLSRIWGSTMCMGFIFIKADVFTISFFEKVLYDMLQTQRMLDAYLIWRDTKKAVNIIYLDNSTRLFDLAWWKAQKNHYPDDQYSSNNLLHRMNIQWPANMSLSQRKEAHVGNITNNGRLYHVTLLPEKLYLRNCVDAAMKYFKKVNVLPSKNLQNIVHRRIQNATIAHCMISSGDYKMKENYSVFYSLWRLPYEADRVARYIAANTFNVGQSSTTSAGGSSRRSANYAQKLAAIRASRNAPAAVQQDKAQSSTSVTTVVAKVRRPSPKQANYAQQIAALRTANDAPASSVQQHQQISSNEEHHDAMLVEKRRQRKQQYLRKQQEQQQTSIVHAKQQQRQDGHNELKGAIDTIDHKVESPNLDLNTQDAPHHHQAAPMQPKGRRAWERSYKQQQKVLTLLQEKRKFVHS